jgi:hypothetical protein
MNLLQTIGAWIAQGFSHAEVAVKLEAEHAITVSEEWVKKITGADGFGVVSEDVEAATKVVETDASAAVQDAQAAVNDVEKKI